ncbi:auxin-binding protein ABP19a-like [Rosa sericea]
MTILFFFFICSHIPSSSFAAVQDFCVADYTAPSGPAGYSCKRPETVTVNDFVYSGLGVSGNTSNLFRVGDIPAYADQVPGLNGLGISMARVDIAPGGVVPLHIHRGATEVFLVVQGTLVAGFISSDRNTVYITTIKSGDIMVFPQGLLHFQVNIGATRVVGFASYSSQSPGLQILDYALFQGNFPTRLIARTTFLDILEIRKLKFIFGGTN